MRLTGLEDRGDESFQIILAGVEKREGGNGTGEKSDKVDKRWVSGTITFEEVEMKWTGWQNQGWKISQNRRVGYGQV